MSKRPTSSQKNRRIGGSSQKSTKKGIKSPSHRRNNRNRQNSAEPRLMRSPGHKRNRSADSPKSVGSRRGRFRGTKYNSPSKRNSTRRKNVPKSPHIRRSSGTGSSRLSVRKDNGNNKKTLSPSVQTGNIGFQKKTNKSETKNTTSSANPTRVLKLFEKYEKKVILFYYHAKTTPEDSFFLGKVPIHTRFHLIYRLFHHLEMVISQFFHGVRAELLDTLFPSSGGSGGENQREKFKNSEKYRWFLVTSYRLNKQRLASVLLLRQKREVSPTSPRPALTQILREGTANLSKQGQKFQKLLLEGLDILLEMKRKKVGFFDSEEEARLILGKNIDPSNHVLFRLPNQPIESLIVTHVLSPSIMWGGNIVKKPCVACLLKKNEKFDTENSSHLNIVPSVSFFPLEDISLEERKKTKKKRSILERTGSTELLLNYRKENFTNLSQKKSTTTSKSEDNNQDQNVMDVGGREGAYIARERALRMLAEDLNTKKEELESQENEFSEKVKNQMDVEIKKIKEEMEVLEEKKIGDFKKLKEDEIRDKDQQIEEMENQIKGLIELHQLRKKKRREKKMKRKLLKQQQQNQMQENSPLPSEDEEGEKEQDEDEEEDDDEEEEEEGNEDNNTIINQEKDNTGEVQQQQHHHHHHHQKNKNKKKKEKEEDLPMDEISIIMRKNPDIITRHTREPSFSEELNTLKKNKEIPMLFMLDVHLNNSMRDYLKNKRKKSLKPNGERKNLIPRIEFSDEMYESFSSSDSSL